MSVQAKFYVAEIVRHEGAPTADRIKMGAVCRGAENKGWASATPWGSIEMGVLNDRATDYFEEGQEYLVTFTKSPKPAPGDGHEPQPVESYGSTMCAFCGVHAVKAADGELDWSGHVEHYGA